MNPEIVKGVKYCRCASVKAPSAYSFKYEIVLDVLYVTDMARQLLGFFMVCNGVTFHDGVHRYRETSIDEVLGQVPVHMDTAGQISTECHPRFGTTQQRPFCARVEKKVSFRPRKSKCKLSTGDLRQEKVYCQAGWLTPTRLRECVRICKLRLWDRVADS